MIIAYSHNKTFPFMNFGILGCGTMFCISQELQYHWLPMPKPQGEENPTKKPIGTNRRIIAVLR